MEYEGGWTKCGYKLTRSQYEHSIFLFGDLYNHIGVWLAMYESGLLGKSLACGLDTRVTVSLPVGRELEGANGR